MASLEDLKPFQISIQCEDNADGVPGVVVYDDSTFAISSERDTIIEGTASGDGQGPYSSVRQFQVARYENEDPVTQDVDPPETDRNSPASLQEEETRQPSVININLRSTT